MLQVHRAMRRAMIGARAHFGAEFVVNGAGTRFFIVAQHSQNLVGLFFAYR